MGGKTWRFHTLYVIAFGASIGTRTPNDGSEDRSVIHYTMEA